MQVLDRSKALAITPLLRLGFRPFFLAGGIFALLAVPLWLSALSGGLGHYQPAGGWLIWHRHELLFGFALAIIAGFLLTAVQSWTGRPGLSGWPLAALAGLWLAARLAWLMALPLPVLALLELAFPLAVAAAMAHTLWQVKQSRNYPVVALLLLICLVDAISFVGLANANEALQRQSVLGGIWLVAAMMGLIGGRVIPFFTQRGLGLAQAAPALPWLDRLVIWGSALIAMLYALGPALQANVLIGLVFVALAAGHSVRLLRWYDRGIWRAPLLWSLHLAYAWLILACLGMAFWHVGLLHNPSRPVHALTVGSIGGLILGMIARVSLGHTGRALEPPKIMSLAFILLNIAGLSRVFLIELWPVAGLWLAAACWTVAFALFIGCYGPMLCQTRADGHPG